MQNHFIIISSSPNLPHLATATVNLIQALLDCVAHYKFMYVCMYVCMLNVKPPTMMTTTTTLQTTVN